MGAWGHGYFEDDAALDFMQDVEDSENPKQLFKDAFEFAIESDYLDSDDANAVIVASAYIDRQVNGTKFSSPEHEELLEVDTFPERNPDTDFSTLREKAIIALQKVLDEGSELNELWAENEEDYPAWKQGIEQLIERLSA